MRSKGKILHFGPYQVQDKDIVGQGGMGVVYRGVHAETGDVVAIKTVLGVSPGHFAAIRREISTLRRVCHPGVVRFLAGDVTDGVPWVAMPLLKGRTLAKYLKALRPKRAGSDFMADEETETVDPAGDPPRVLNAPAPGASARPLRPMLTLIRRICAPLAFLHGEGLVHRDLKPANVFLQHDGRPVLVDMGLAIHFGAGGREELDVEPIAGTPVYMAPEQIRGELVDARADLYALGCILYECVTGRPPFTGKSKHSLCNQHFHEQPLRPSRWVRHLPPALDELILKLLEKDPQVRIGYAADVAAALGNLGAEAVPDDGPTPRAYLYRPQIAGRADELATLEKMIDRVAGQRRGGLALVWGESGVGKTRLAKEVIRKASSKALTVLTGRCVAPGAGEAGATAAVASPLYPLRSVLVTAAERARDSRAEADRLFGRRGKVLSPYLRELVDLPGQKELLAPPPLPPEKARARVITAMQETLWALAETSPLLIVLDDLQWADDLTLSVLAALAKDGLDGHGMLLVATYRIEETHPELDLLARAPGVATIELGRLKAWSVAKMIEGMLAQSALPWDALDALIRHSNGNPFFVAEYLRTAIAEGILRRDKDGRFCFDARDAAGALSSLPLPHTLEELIGRRLKSLDAEGWALAAWAAVLGQELDDDLLRLGARDDDAAAEALHAVRARQILEETEDGQLRFVHDKIREVAYQRIADDKRVELHRRAGEALEARYAAAPDKAPALGYHFAGAGMHDKASFYFAKAARRAQEIYANRDAIRFYKAAIDALLRTPRAEADHAELAALHESLGDVLGLIGDQKEARAAYRAALDATSPLAHVAMAQLHRKSGKTWEMRHQHANALKLYKKAEVALGPARAVAPPRVEAWWHEWLQIQLDRISVYYWQADVKRIRARVKAIRPVIKSRGKPLQHGHYLHALTQLHIQEERFVASARTVRYARKCVAAYEAAGEPRDGHWGLVARCSLAIFLLLQGALEEAEEQLADARSDAMRTGDLEAQSRCLTYLTVIHRRLRRIGPAEDLARKSLQLAREENIREYVGAALGNLSWIALSRNEHAEAERAGREALSCWKQPPHEKQLPHMYPFQWLARLPLCFVALAQGRLQDAIEQAQAVLDVRQQRLPARLTAPLEAAVAAFAKGQQDRAKDALSRARRAVQPLGYA